MTSMILLRDWQASQCEFWKPVESWGMYEVSNFGRVRSYWKMRSDGFTFYSGIGLEPRILTPHYDKRGYCRVILRDRKRQRTVPIHRLVAGAFIANPNELPDVNHLTGIRYDNRLHNLEWASK